MSQRCPNCDQRLLPDDQVCWHCGLILASPSDAPAAPAPPSPQAPRAQPQHIYGALTAATILLALLLTVYLGSQPRSRRPLGSPPQGWGVSSDRAQSFVLFLPQDWRQFTAEVELAELLAQEPRYHAALAPLAAAVDDEEVIMLVRGQHPLVFLIVARSERLNRLPAAEAASLFVAGEEGVLEARSVQSQGAAQAEFHIDLHNDGELHCRQRFIPGDATAFLFSLCTPPSALPRQTIDTLLSNIQLLR